MKRDWIGELQDKGLRVKDISRETGIPQRTLRAYIKGERAFNTKSKHYETIRNTNRRLAARELREVGMTAKQADRYKRTYFDSEAKVKKTLYAPEREVKRIQATDSKFFHQLYIIAIFRNTETDKRKAVEGWSRIHLDKDYNRDFEEALFNAKEVVEDESHYVRGNNWELDSLLEEGYVTTKEARDNT